MQVSKQAIESAIIEARRYKFSVDDLDIQMIRVGKAVRDQSVFSNEFLWRLARAGSKRALATLYNKTKRLWMKRIPVDRGGMNTKEDWLQIAAEEFTRKWQKFDFDRGYKFNTFIVRVVSNRWINVLRELKCDRQRIHAETTSETVFESFSNLLAVEFVGYDDIEIFGVFVDRFMNYFKEEEDDQRVHDVLDVKLWSGDMSVASVARLLRWPVQHVGYAFYRIRKHVIDFCNIERAVRHDHTVFG